MNRKQREIDKMKVRPFGCGIKILQPGKARGKVCAFRAWTNSDIKKHETSHRDSIISGQRNNSRFYEVEEISEKSFITTHLEIEGTAMSLQNASAGSIEMSKPIQSIASNSSEIVQESESFDDFSSSLSTQVSVQQQVVAFALPQAKPQQHENTPQKLVAPEPVVNQSQADSSTSALLSTSADDQMQLNTMGTHNRANLLKHQAAEFCSTNVGQTDKALNETIRELSISNNKKQEQNDLLRSQNEALVKQLSELGVKHTNMIREFNGKIQILTNEKEHILCILTATKQENDSLKSQKKNCIKELADQERKYVETIAHLTCKIEVLQSHLNQVQPHVLYSQHDRDDENVSNVGLKFEKDLTVDECLSEGDRVGLFELPQVKSIDIDAGTLDSENKEVKDGDSIVTNQSNPNVSISSSVSNVDNEASTDNALQPQETQQIQIQAISASDSGFIVISMPPTLRDQNTLRSQQIPTTLPPTPRGSQSQILAQNTQAQKINNKGSDNDSVVSSTPNLYVSRRADSISETISSPQPHDQAYQLPATSFTFAESATRSRTRSYEGICDTCDLTPSLIQSEESEQTFPNVPLAVSLHSPHDTDSATETSKTIVTQSNSSAEDNSRQQIHFDEISRDNALSNVYTGETATTTAVAESDNVQETNISPETSAFQCGNISTTVTTSSLLCRSPSKSKLGSNISQRTKTKDNFGMKTFGKPETNELIAPPQFNVSSGIATSFFEVAKPCESSQNKGRKSMTTTLPQNEPIILTGNDYDSIRSTESRISRKRIHCDKNYGDANKKQREAALNDCDQTPKKVAHPEKPEDVVKRTDSSTKSLDLLIQHLFESKRIHAIHQNLDERNKKSAKASAKPRTRPRAKPSVKPSVKSSAKPKEKPSVKPSTDPVDFGQLRMDRLNGYEVPPEIAKIENKEDVSYLATVQKMVQDSTVDPSKYNQAYSALLHLEEAAETQTLQQYNQQSLKIIHSQGTTFQMKNDENTRKIDQAIEECLVDTFVLRTSYGYSPKITISGQMKRCDKEYIYFDVFEKYLSIMLNYCNKHTFDISFKVNRMPYRIQHMALDYFQKHNLHSRLIANEKYFCLDDSSVGKTNQSMVTDYNFSGTLAEGLNEQQKTVVASIAKMDRPASNSLPYLLFGPAGTGKTRTLVATIEEIVRSSSKYVLVCANSNAACDEITERLSRILEPHEFFRLYAKSYNGAKLSSEIKRCSNFVQQAIKYPCLRFLYKFRVLVCTLSIAGNLMRARGDPDFDATHFSHIIIDECANSNETTTLVPIAGVCSNEDGIQANIVLAGDPKQLDAVCKSSNASKLGHKISLMERLFNLPLYMRNKETGKFNSKFITQLVDNYRTHEAILYVANRLFYDNTLVCKASEETTNWFLNSSILPSEIPIIFKAVYGQTAQTENDCSMFNMKEAHAVIDQIKDLMKPGVSSREIKFSDIGIVTPYRKQCQIINRLCRRLNFNGVTIGTAEVFQGQEKPIMIVSTVRTGGTLGFVNSAQRMNVVLTRAQCLLVVIGDPETLYTDDKWSYLLEFCKMNDSFIQSKDKTFEFPRPIIQEHY